MRSNERNGASVIERAFRLLDVFMPMGRDLGLAEIARRTELPKTTVYRLASQLVEIGALERRENKYRLGIHLFEIGSAVSRQRRLREAALPFMEDLYEATHETIHLGVLDGNNVLYIEKISGRRSSPVATQIGTRKPIYCTALGKAILSFSQKPLIEDVMSAGLTRRTPHTIGSPAGLMRDVAATRSGGVAYDREEFALGITCVAVPLLNEGGTADAALSITGPTSRFHAENFAIAIRTAGLGLSRVLRNAS